MTSELVGKQMALLKEVVPNVSLVAVLWNPANPLGAPQLKEANAAAQALAVQLQVLGVRAPTEFEGAFAAMTRARAEALLVLPDAIFAVNGPLLGGLAAKSRLPAMYGLRELVETGGLMAYGPHYADLFRRAATYVDKILKAPSPVTCPSSRRQSSSW
jgi:putative tryptophan/tyrosine transport system substrate-binding protein